MKKLLFILSLLIIANLSFAQVKVGSNGNIIATGHYPVANGSDIKGTLHFFQTIVQRNALPANFRDTGMLAYVGDSAQFYYLNNSISNSAWTLWQGGGSGCAMTYSMSSDSLYKYYIDCHVDTLYTGYILGDSTSGGSVNAFDSLRNNAGTLEGRKAGVFVPQFVLPTGGAASWGTISGTLSSQTDLQNALNLKLNSSDSVIANRITVNTANIGTNTTAIAGKQNQLSGTGFVQMIGTTPSYITSPIDSLSYHTVSLDSGDSLLIFSKPNGHIDTISFALLQYWKKNLKNIYLDSSYNVGIGTSSPTAALVVRRNSLATPATIPNDSLGIKISNTFVSTGVTNVATPAPLSWYGNSWTSASGGSSYKTATRFRPYQASTTIAIPPDVYLEGSIDGGVTYPYVMGRFSWAGAYIVGSSSYGANSTVVNALTANGIATGNISTSSFVNVGSVNDYGAMLTVTPPNANQGFLPPRLTTAQRNSINLVVTSFTIVNAGTGFASVPTITIAPTYMYPSAGGTATATLSGSTLGSVSVVTGGHYYQTPLVTVTGGGGSGAVVTANVTQTLTTGTTLFCTDCTATDSSTGVMQTWNGTTWKNNW